MRNLIFLLPLLALTGCNQSTTRAAFEANEARYSKKVMEIPAVDASALTVIQYEDYVPSMDFAGNNYQRTLVIRTIGVDAQGNIKARGKQ